jgi:hypothetical protein
LAANQIVHSARRDQQKASPRDRVGRPGSYSFSAVSTEGFMRVALGLTAASGVTLMPR